MFMDARSVVGIPRRQIVYNLFYGLQIKNSGERKTLSPPIQTGYECMEVDS
jgi:hypothetical protein